MLVTGVGRGMGQSHAVRLAEGADVVLVDTEGPLPDIAYAQPCEAAFVTMQLVDGIVARDTVRCPVAIESRFITAYNQCPGAGLTEV